MRQDKRQWSQSNLFRSVTAVHRTSGHFVALVPAIRFARRVRLMVVRVQWTVIAVAAAHVRSVPRQGCQWSIEQQGREETEVRANPLLSLLAVFKHLCIRLNHRPRLRRLATENTLEM
jgi:hypothetical protein